MGNKIFISYKYRDSDVKGISTISSNYPKVRDYVTWLENKFTNRTEHVYKGESDNEDLSDKSEDYIWRTLKDKIFDSSITIVLVSPNMKEARKWEKSQWIPWEISYSLRETPRNSYTSHSNAVLAVILPDRNGNYSYYESMTLFSILKKNIDIGYIPVVTWDNFQYNCDTYIKKAYEAQKNTPEYKVSKMFT